MIRKALKRVRNHPSYLFVLFGIDIVLGCHNIVMGILNRLDDNSPEWFGNSITIAGIISVGIGALGARSVRRQRAKKKQEEAKAKAQRQANLDRRARASLRRPSSRATVELMHAIEFVRDRYNDPDFTITNFHKLRFAEEQVIDDYFDRVQPLLVKFSGSYSVEVQAEAQIELELAALSAANDLHFLRTINNSIGAST